MSDKASAALPWPAEDFSVYGPVEARPLGRMQNYVARVMNRNWSAIPHVTHHEEADIGGFERRRKQWNEAHPDARYSLLAGLVKAAVAALQRYPSFNVSLSADGTTVFAKQYWHVGVAVDTPGGLLVPVLRDCERKSLEQISAEIARLSEKARGKGLSMAEMSGGCFTISSLGHIGGSGFTPIINAPEVAILGVCRAHTRFVPDASGNPVVCQSLPLSLSYDHRVINGAEAARFASALSDWFKQQDAA
jgi:pyruvate dehydrogenase E2 component (dihydrolipoamide acetyltransferase)